MQKTKNLKLDLLEPTDSVSSAPLNANAVAVDAAVTADRAANAERADALQAGIDALAANLGSVGHNCRFATGSYMGKNVCGASNPTVIRFDFYPVLVIVLQNHSGSTNCIPAFIVRGSKNQTIASSRTATLAWTDRSVSFYSKTAFDQMNADQPYVWLAFGWDG